MIYDRLEHIGRYRGLGAHLDRAIDFLTKADVALLTGRGEIDGDRVYYMEQNPQLRAPAFLNCHIYFLSQRHLHFQNNL